MTASSGDMITILGNSQTTAALADALGQFMDGPVRDATELTGTYDFSLYFESPSGIYTPQAGPPGELLPGFTPAAEPLPSIFEALKGELGLRLEIIRGPIEVLIIDHADRIPTGN